MGTVKRWLMSVSSRVDSLMVQIENHEGVINATIRRTHEAVARANVQLKRVHKDGERLQEQQQAARLAEQAWRDRARACMNKDEARAIECLRRSKAAEKNADEIEKRIKAHDAASKKLTQDIFIIKKRLSELVEKRNLMRTRQTRAEALQTAHSSVEFAMNDIEDIFNRWESKVAVAESLGGYDSEQDMFLETFLKDEEQHALREELAALRECSSC